MRQAPRSLVWRDNMKRILLTVSLCLAVLLTLAGCSGNSNSDNSTGSENGSAGVPNPLVTYKTVEEAAAAMGQPAKVPGTMLWGFARRSIDVIDGIVMQITYEGEKKSMITYRTASIDEGDISGDYNEYLQENELTIGGMTVLTGGEGDLISLALWDDGEMAYSFLFDSPVDEDTLESLITSIE